jgi:hypothetical protein
MNVDGAKGNGKGLLSTKGLKHWSSPRALKYKHVKEMMP